MSAGHGWPLLITQVRFARGRRTRHDTGRGAATDGGAKKSGAASSCELLTTPDRHPETTEATATGPFDQGCHLLNEQPTAPKPKPPRKPFSYRRQFGVIVLCADEREQARVYRQLARMGHTCKVVVT